MRILNFHRHTNSNSRPLRQGVSEDGLRHNFQLYPQENITLTQDEVWTLLPQLYTYETTTSDQVRSLG